MSQEMCTATVKCPCVDDQNGPLPGCGNCGGDGTFEMFVAALVSEHGGVSWRSETILPEGAMLFAQVPKKPDINDDPYSAGFEAGFAKAIEHNNEMIRRLNGAIRQILLDVANGIDSPASKPVAEAANVSLDHVIRMLSVTRPTRA